ncbi:hypothetical protein [Sutcliffiella halmapala]|uniref:hypothetical protein n=1 Tax=Sutcliffiella halmapala TaxID=79882 RepID=UPI000995385A|nr:hypothetical protein [Sutcliffiella halmapala]
MSLYFEWRKSCGCRVPCNCDTSPKSKEPRYYFSQTKQTIEIPADASVEVLKLDVVIKLPLEKVKLDSVISTVVKTGEASEYSFHTEFSLWRNDTLITTENYAAIKQLGQDTEIKTLMNTVYLSWTDFILTPGSYTYKVKARRIETSETNIMEISANDRALNAIVFHAGSA